MKEGAVSMNRFNKLCLIAFLSALVVCAPLQISFAASLWVDDSSGIDLFADHKARLVGDSLTIIINESSRATRTGSSNNSKSGETDLAAGTGIFHFLAAAGASSSDSFQSSGNISNSNSVTGRITVQVTEVKPNGNLVVSGTQTITQNKDVHKIVITGVVRPDDVTRDNTVLSSYVADAELTFDGKGPITEKQRQGILTQILNFIF